MKKIKIVGNNIIFQVSAREKSMWGLICNYAIVKRNYYCELKQNGQAVDIGDRDWDTDTLEEAEAWCKASN